MPITSATLRTDGGMRMGSDNDTEIIDRKHFASFAVLQSKLQSF
jgi:hypothetical protein